MCSVVVNVAYNELSVGGTTIAGLQYQDNTVVTQGLDRLAQVVRMRSAKYNLAIDISV